MIILMVMDSTVKRVKIFNNSAQADEAFKEKSIRVLRIGDKKVCLAKVNDEFFAFDALCPHQRHPLKESTINAFQEVICPLHSYRFNLKTGAEAHHLCKPMNTFPVEISEAGLFIKLY